MNREEATSESHGQEFTFGHINWDVKYGFGSLNYRWEKWEIEVIIKFESV